jgi:ubiquinone/menaquinone biosynthesis C-methylase UbiE
MMEQKTFQELEHAGWLAKAHAYDELFATITDQAIPYILTSFGDLAQKRLLDIACGTGHLAGTSHNYGAISEGVDFASAMVEKSSSNYPGVTFKEGNAEQLPYHDDTFDTVACGFGLLHLERPEQAMREAWRVLKRGGRYTFTVWCGPDQGGEFFKLVINAIQKHGSLDVPLPPAPPMFRFADSQEAKKVLIEAGFSVPEVTILPLVWRATRPEDILDLIYKSIVRMPMLLEAQPAQARHFIHQEIIESSDKFRNGNALEIQFPAVMATAQKA